MRRRFPLNSVRAVEAAGRHLNLARAAAELNVTPTAISHHIRTLEDFLQTRLFDRAGGLSLTREGRLCLRGMTDGLDRLDAALGETSVRERRAEVVVRLTACFASLWLVPRLPGFLAEHPDIDVTLATTLDPDRFGDDDIDIGIRYTRGQHLNRNVERLMDEEIVPVCAPSLLGEERAPSAQRLCAAPLVHDDSLATVPLFPDWQRYFDTVDIRRFNARRGVRFNQSDLAVKAAVSGLGILLGRSRLIEPALADGTLLRCEADIYPIKFYYYVVSRGIAASSAAGAFLEWLFRQIDKQK